MYGYCSEQIVFEMADAERLKKDFCFPLYDSFFAHFYLQATNDLLHALEKIIESNIIQKVVPAEMFPPDTIVCRALEILFKQGFDSTVYQRLVNNHHCRHALATGCSSKNKSELESVSSRFGINHLAILYDIDTYLTREGAFDLRTLTPLKKECHELLRSYIRWWLEGKGLAEEDDGGFSLDDLTSFSIIYRAIWFSLLFLGRYQAATPILIKMVTTNPSSFPFFDGLDLWLQRQSALMLYDLEGLTPFVDNLDNVRGSLIYFIDLKRGLTDTQKHQLLECAKRLPGGDAGDMLGFSLKGWLEKGLEM